MSNKTLPTTSRGCSCCDAGAGNIAGQGGGFGGGGSANIIVRHKQGTVIGNVIKEYNEQGVTVYELDDQILAFPVVVFTNNAPITEIGQTIDIVTFSGSITAATFPIAIRSLTPDPGGVDITAPFTFQKLDVKRTTPGVAELHTLSATDTEGNTTTKQSGVTFKHAVYRGYNTASSVSELDIKAMTKTLNDSIAQQYGGEKTYVVPGPGASNYIYWTAPIGTPGIAGATLSGFALPLVDLTPVDVTNIHDGSIITPYWVKRTANKFDPGTYKIILS